MENSDTLSYERFFGEVPGRRTTDLIGAFLHSYPPQSNPTALLLLTAPLRNVFPMLIFMLFLPLTHYTGPQVGIIK